MLLSDIRDFLVENSGAEQVLENEGMAKYTTFRVGGPAELLYLPKTEEEIAECIKICRLHDVPVTLIGNGSNLIVRDGGIKGVTIRLAENFAGVEVMGNRITARAGESLARVSNAAKRASLTGLEFASGIPGSLGGAMAMNAGAYGGQMSDVVVSARVLDIKSLEIRMYNLEALEMGYRTSRPLKEGGVVLSAEMALEKGNIAEIGEKMDELNRRRREKQPLTYPSAGSTFKRPEGYFAGALIEKAGLKGVSVGGAQVSELHAGFIINTGNANAKDILALIELVKKRVYEDSGVMMETEVRVLGEDT
ncbi:MAG: UDP-N-acetylmuramate dehydrogenase [Clostridia bacterium]|nr:UDP-N-acetylmuramate dehydrogenase [Clostridia bacterium]